MIKACTFFMNKTTAAYTVHSGFFKRKSAQRSCGKAQDMYAHISTLWNPILVTIQVTCLPVATVVQ